MKRAAAAIAVVFWRLRPKLTWGDLGHEVVATIAYRHLTPAGGPRDRAMQSFAIGKRDAYNLPSRPTCAQPRRRPVAGLPEPGQNRRSPPTLVAGVRLAYILDGALGGAGR
jgi:hypothetical protein